jgi:predicted choloylglycine hydrolase
MTTAMSVAELSLEFRSINEPQPGPRLRDVFEAHWPSYHRWLLKRTHVGPSEAECAAQLRAHMPELVPTYESLLGVVGREEQRARFLSLYAPTPIIRGCSQAICMNGNNPVLVRNYDHAPHLCDGVVLATQWGGVGVHALTDCLWGALDGVNDAGLVVALAFGGRKTVGNGFAASLIVRYLLQTCTCVREARIALARLPVYMAYNFTVLDRSGEHVTAYTSPDRPAVFEVIPVSTNHQCSVEWPEYARFTQTVERYPCLARLVDQHAGHAQVIEACLQPPPYRTEYQRGSGTLYTVKYDPHSMDVSMYWRGTSAVISPEDSRPARIRITYHAE